MTVLVDAVEPVGGQAKRALDILAALTLIAFFLPLMAMIYAALRVSGHGSPIFAHRRVGIGGLAFGCYKFRTMVPDAQQVLEQLLADDPAARVEWAETQKLRNDPRITRLGRILRALSLDELPQLFNVLLGDMSLVGPRPIVDAERPRYGSQIDYYTRARPGITGLWQVTARGSGDYDQRVALDVAYVREWSLRGDLSILLRTARVVMAREGSW